MIKDLDVVAFVEGQQAAPADRDANQLLDDRPTSVGTPAGRFGVDALQPVANAVAIGKRLTGRAEIAGDLRIAQDRKGGLDIVDSPGTDQLPIGFEQHRHHVIPWQRSTRTVSRSEDIRHAGGCRANARGNWRFYFVLDSYTALPSIFPNLPRIHSGFPREPGNSNRSLLCP
jgi:hypothetical protein